MFLVCICLNQKIFKVFLNFDSGPAVRCLILHLFYERKSLNKFVLLNHLAYRFNIWYGNVVNIVLWSFNKFKQWSLALSDCFRAKFSSCLLTLLLVISINTCKDICMLVNAALAVISGRCFGDVVSLLNLTVRGKHLERIWF